MNNECPINTINQEDKLIKLQKENDALRAEIRMLKLEWNMIRYDLSNANREIELLKKKDCVRCRLFKQAGIFETFEEKLSNFQQNPPSDEAWQLVIDDLD